MPDIYIYKYKELPAKLLFDSNFTLTEDQTTKDITVSLTPSSIYLEKTQGVFTLTTTVGPNNVSLGNVASTQSQNSQLTGSHLTISSILSSTSETRTISIEAQTSSIEISKALPNSTVGSSLTEDTLTVSNIDLNNHPSTTFFGLTHETITNVDYVSIKEGSSNYGNVKALSFYGNVIGDRVASGTATPLSNGFELKKSLLSLSNRKAGQSAQYSNFTVEYDSTYEDYDTIFDGTLEVGLSGKSGVLVNRMFDDNQDNVRVNNPQISVALIATNVFRQAKLTVDGISFYNANGSHQNTGFTKQLYNDLRINDKVLGSTSGIVDADSIKNASVIYISSADYKETWEKATYWSYAGQRRMIFNNTSSTLTISYPQARINSSKAWEAVVSSTSSVGDLGTLIIPAYCGRYVTYTGNTTTFGGLDLATFVAGEC